MVESLVYVFAAYTVIWLVSFGYLYSIGLRQKRLQREIDALKSALTTEGSAKEDVEVFAR